MLRTSLITGAALLIAAMHEPACAQSQSLFGSSGPRAQSGNSGRSMSGMNSSSGMGGMQGAGDLSGFGSRGAGGSGGRGGAGGNFTGPQLNQMGQLSAQAVGTGTGFVGQTNQGGFVGNRMAGAANAAGMQPSFGSFGGGRGGRGAFGASSFNGSDFNQNNARQNQSGTPASSFRPRYRVGLEAQPDAATMSARASARVEQLKSRNPRLAGVDIAIDPAGNAEIRGQAPTPEARRLIENLVRLEPGVRSITNLVKVQPSAPSAANP